MKTELLKIDDVCKELNVTRQTIYNWKNKGLIHFIKSPSGSIFVANDELYEKLKSFYSEFEIKKND